jgi:hypothetical protein
MVAMAQGSLQFAGRPANLAVARAAVNKADPRQLFCVPGDVTGPRNGDFAGLFFSAFPQIFETLPLRATRFKGGG